MTVSQAALESEFATQERELLLKPDLAREFVNSQVHFFAARDGASIARDTLSHRRHLEWFLLERASESESGVPLELLVHERAQSPDPEDVERDTVLAALLGSLASIFEVTSVVDGEGLWVRDLAGGGEYVLTEPELSGRLQLEDLVVGRIFPVGDSLHRVSNAAGFFRDERLSNAVRKDLERARAARTGSLRLSQLELEKMFLGSTAGREEEDAWVKAREYLGKCGVAPERVEHVHAVLRAQPYDPENLVAGAADGLGTALTELAFEGGVDLEAARVLLLAAWVQLSRPVEQNAVRTREPRRSADGGVDVAAAMKAFDEGRAEGRDLEQLFDELERDLGIDEDDNEEEAIAPDFPGVVGAMVEEYLWELEQEQGPEAAAAHAVLRRFAEYGADIGLFESLSVRELLVFGAVWLPEVGGLEGPEDARATLEALRDFCRWCETAQSVPLAQAFESGPSGMLESLPRVMAVNRAREGGVAPDEGSLHEVLAVEGSRVVLGDAQGERLEVDLEPELAGKLVPGDRIRGEHAPEAGLRIYCCYPPECALIAPA